VQNRDSPSIRRVELHSQSGERNGQVHSPQKFATASSSSTNPQTSRTMKKGNFLASTGGSVIPVTQCQQSCASTEGCRRAAKIGIILEYPLEGLSEIKLKRTDTTLDLSQKAKRAGKEKEEKKKESGQVQGEQYIFQARLPRVPRLLYAKPL